MPINYREPYTTLHSADLVEGSINAAQFETTKVDHAGWDGGWSTLQHVQWLYVVVRNLVGGPIDVRFYSRVTTATPVKPLHLTHTLADGSHDLLVFLPALYAGAHQVITNGMLTYYAPAVGVNPESLLMPPYINFEIERPAGSTGDRLERHVTGLVAQAA